MIEELDIIGVKKFPLKIIETNSGPVLHMLKPDCPLLPDFSQQFGELYFSEVKANSIKAWKRHKKQTQLFAVPSGLLKIVLFDARNDSKTNGKVLEILLGRPDHYALLQIPPMIWYGFTALNNSSALICNCADIAHDPLEGEKISFNDQLIPYKW